MADPKNSIEQNGRSEAPEAYNDGQEDESAQAQTLADEILAERRRGAEALADGEPVSDSIKPAQDDAQDDVPDVVDRMNQMETSGHIDNDAFRGERNDDDEEGGLGRGGMDDRQRPRGAE